MQSPSLNSKPAPTACGTKKYRQERYRMKSLPLAYILPYKRTRVRSHQLSIYLTPALAAARTNRLADSSSPAARASQAARAPLPASASAREPKCFWICAATPCARPSCPSGARGSTSCRAPRAGLRGGGVKAGRQAIGNSEMARAEN